MIRTIGKDGQAYLFRYLLEDHFDSIENITKVLFKTFWAEGNPEKWFDFKIAKINTSTIKVTDMFDDMGCYKGKGLPEQLILEVKKLFPGMKVISSSNKKRVLKREGRTEAATIVWRRLVKNGKAYYNDLDDIFILK